MSTLDLLGARAYAAINMFFCLPTNTQIIHTNGLSIPTTKPNEVPTGKRKTSEERAAVKLSNADRYADTKRLVTTELDD